MLSYKGYVGRVEFDDEAKMFHGEVVGIQDVITFQGKTVSSMKKSMAESVEDYLGSLHQTEIYAR